LEDKVDLTECQIGHAYNVELHCLKGRVEGKEKEELEAMEMKKF